MENNNVPTGKYAPLSPWAYWGLTLLFTVPVVGFVFLIVFSISDGNINRRNFARSYWISLILALALCAIVALIGLLTGSFEEIISYIRNLF